MEADSTCRRTQRWCIRSSLRTHWGLQVLQSRLEGPAPGQPAAGRRGGPSACSAGRPRTGASRRAPGLFLRPAARNSLVRHAPADSTAVPVCVGVVAAAQLPPWPGRQGGRLFASGRAPHTRACPMRAMQRSACTPVSALATRSSGMRAGLTESILVTTKNSLEARRLNRGGSRERSLMMRSSSSCVLSLVASSR